MSRAINDHFKHNPNKHVYVTQDNMNLALEIFERNVAKHIHREGTLAVRGKDIPILLYDLLKERTPYKTETRIRKIIISHIKDSKQVPLKDAFGNMWCDVKDNGKNSKIMFSSHMDTMGGKGELDLYMSKGSDKDQGFVFGKDKGLQTDCVLGADDKIGVYIMLLMIRQNIPGMYVFHVGEEVGCLGSKWLKTKYEKIISKRYTHCIAFDRMGYGDVISSQKGRQMTSKKFVDTLAEEFNNLIKGKGVYIWKPESGVYTDSAEYASLIPECTNLSVGYFNQHGSRERFDTEWLHKHFLPAVFKLKWSKLPAERDPRTKDSIKMLDKKGKSKEVPVYKYYYNLENIKRFYVSIFQV